MRRLATFVLTLFTLLAFAGIGAPRAHAADAAPYTIDLYTIGPGDYLFSRYGHSLLCVEGGPASLARCYDYGIPDVESATHMTWGSIRGEKIFIAVGVDEKAMLDVFLGQGRQVEKQRLPLAPEAAEKLATRLDDDVKSRHAYAYHPYYANCTTEVRDRIDEAFGGRIHEGPAALPPDRFRDLAEEGLTGRLFELTAMAFTLGEPNEKKPTGWEIMFLPASLRDSVRDRLGAQPELVKERQAVILPTSRSIGRTMLVILAIVLLVSANLAAKPSRARQALVPVALVLGGMALLAELTAVLVVWPEFRHNWALLLLWPTDLALPWMKPRVLARYAQVRAGVAVLFAVLEVAGVVAAPILPVVAIVALPMFAIARVARRADQRVTEAMPTGA